MTTLPIRSGPHSSAHHALLFLCISCFLCLAALPVWAQTYAGSTLWGPDDLPVAVEPGAQGISSFGPGLAMLPDGAGGAFLAWVDNSAGLVVVQRLDPDGRFLWPANVPVADAPGPQFGPAMTPDGAGGVILAWVQGGAADSDVYAQRLSATGARLWGAVGVPVVTAAGNQGMSGLAVVRNLAGGAIAVWEDGRPPNCCRYYAQRLDAAGLPVWATDGVPVSPPVTIVIGPVSAAPVAVLDTAGGAFVGYLDQQRDPITVGSRFVVQRLGFDGSLLWPSPGVEVGRPTYGGEEFGGITTDGQSGIIAAWSPPVAGTVPHTLVRAQRISPMGVKLWGPDGVVLASAVGTKRHLDVAADGGVGAVVAWADDRNGNPGDCSGLTGNCDIYAQRVSAGGVPIWTAGGVQVTAAPRTQNLPMLAVEPTGGAVVVWQDCRDYADLNACVGNMDLYAQRLTGDGLRRWPGGDLAVSRAAGNQGVAPGTPPRRWPRAIAAEGGAIVAWPDGRDGPCESAGTSCDVYAQRTGEEIAPPPPPPPPPIPSDLEAYVDDVEVLLVWTAPVGEVVQGYLIEAGSAPGASDLAVVPTGSSDPIFYVVAPPGRYFVRVRAVLVGGALTAASNEIALVVGCAGPPPPPTAVTVALSGWQVTFTWIPPPGFAVAYWVDAGSAPGLADVALLDLPYFAEGFSTPAPPGTYYVRVQSVNLCGPSVPSAELIVTVGAPVPLPAAPAGLTAGVASGAVTLDWTAPPGDMIGYQIEAGSADGFADLATIRIGASTTFMTSAPPGVYHVRVRGISAAGTGPPSADVVVAVP